MNIISDILLNRFKHFSLKSQTHTHTYYDNKRIRIKMMRKTYASVIMNRNDGK